MPDTKRKKNESQYRFENGQLHICKGSFEMVIQGWNPPTATRRTQQGSEWEPFNPDFQLIRPYRRRKKGGLSDREESGGQQTFDFFDSAVSRAHHAKPKESLAEQRKKALDSFRFSLPREVASALEPFRVRQWNLLMLLYHDPGSIDLVKSNPTLAFFLAQKLNGDVDLIRSLRCSSMRQREILSLVEFPSSNAAVKLIKKIQPASITSDNWETIGRLLRSELSKEKTPLGHLSRINLGVMEIVNDPVASAAVGSKLLEDVANDHREKYRGRVVHMINSALEMQEELTVKREVTFFPDLQRLYDVHERVTSQYRRRARQLREVEVASLSGEFPPPPFAGIPELIEPVNCPGDLVDEGEEQGNCVASYARRIMKGNLFIYRVLKPQRATLSIVKKNKKWVVGELEAKFNTAASDETETRVRQWLEMVQD